MSIKTRLLISFLVLALVPLIAVSVVFYIVGTHTVTHQVLHHLETNAAIQKHRVEDLLAQNSERLALVESRTSLQQSLAEYAATGNPASLDTATASMQDAMGAIPDFTKLSMMGLDGTVLASTDPSMIGKNESGTPYFKMGNAGNNVGVFARGPDDALTEYLTGPIAVDGRKLGVLAIEARANNLTELMRDYTGLGATGETVIATRSPEGNAVFIGPTRFGESKPLSTVVPGSEANVPINIALQGKVETLSNNADYRGKPVLAATEHIGNPDLGLVVKMDRAEALSPVNNLALVLIVVVVIVALLIVLFSLYTARSMTRPITALTGVAEAVAAGDLSMRSGIERADEIGTLATAFDKMTDDLVSEREGLEQKVEERTAELARANLELDGYAHSVSHDLRGPISSINIAGNLLKDTLAEPPGPETTSEMNELAEDIIHNTRKSFALINDLLALAEAGQQPTQVEEVDLRKVVEQVLQERKGEIEKFGTRAMVDDDLGTVVANETHMYQLFSNLIGNAIRHNHAPEPFFEVHMLGVAEGAGRRYEVRDNGPGIPSEDYDRIFEPFFKGKGGDTGVGLATVRKIVEIYGGTIQACKDKGEGTCFEFVLRDYAGPLTGADAEPT